MFVDYRCERCGGVMEQRLPSPPPPTLVCVACGGAARRLFSAPAVLRGGPAPGPAPTSPSLPACLENRGIPALCHLDPSVAPAWIARAKGDNRALERELARQETVASSRAHEEPDAAPSPVARTHTHHHAGS